MSDDKARAIYDRLCQHAREVAILNSTQSLLGWDERTKLPSGGGGYRAEQMSYLAGLIHKKQTAPEVGEWLVELTESPLAADPHSDTGADIVNLKRDYDRKTKLPQALVEELAKLSVLGQQLWVEARKANDFGRFRPLLERTIELKRREAAAIGYEKEPYDALLDEFEPGAKTSEVAKTLGGLREQLVPLVAAISGSSKRPNLDALQFQSRSARHDEPSVLHWYRAVRYSPYDALRREFLARLAFQYAPRGWPRHLRARPAGRAVRSSHWRGRVAGHP
jgi:carboxypeptidase Taq